MQQLSPAVNEPKIWKDSLWLINLCAENFWEIQYFTTTLDMQTKSEEITHKMNLSRGNPNEPQEDSYKHKKDD